ncbi:MAG: FtsQ-type POTRA domain-containing protein [Solirubrobacteraceae bacterium]
MHLRYKLGLAALALLATYGLWLGLLRNLALFEVQSVTISGLAGNATPQIASTLELTAREMTTTNFSLARLRSSVASYPSVASLRVRTEFPHGLRIEVVERRPLARLDYDGTIVAVASNDHVLSGLAVPRTLPLVRSSFAPRGDRVTDPLALEELALLAAAPEALRSHVYQVRMSNEGLTVRLRHGPLIYFGDDALRHAKWDSAAVVLANPSSRGARYIDVSLPARPAAAIGDPSTEELSTSPQGTASVATIIGGASAEASSSTSG